MAERAALVAALVEDLRRMIVADHDLRGSVWAGGRSTGRAAHARLFARPSRGGRGAACDRRPDRARRPRAARAVAGRRPVRLRAAHQRRRRRPRRPRALVASPPRGEPGRLTRGPADSSPAWSPDGSRSRSCVRQDGPPQLWLLPADGGEPEQLTTLPLGAGAPVWSPDGARIAFAAPGRPAPARRGRPGARRGPRADRRRPARLPGRRRGLPAHGAQAPARGRRRTKECRQLTSGDWHAGDPAWSPDGTTLAFAAATAPDADLRFRAPVYVVDVDGPARARAGRPGRRRRRSRHLDAGRLGAARRRLPRRPGRPRRPAPRAARRRRARRPRRVARPQRDARRPRLPGGLPQFAGDGRTVLFCVRDRGCTHLYSVPVDGGAAPSPVVGGAGRVVSAASRSRATRPPIVLGTPTSFGEIVAVDLATGARRSAPSTARASPTSSSSRARSASSPISDGTVVHGWLVRDPDAPARSRCCSTSTAGRTTPGTARPTSAPLPPGAGGPRLGPCCCSTRAAATATARSSSTAALGAWGEADAKDFLEPIDQLVAEGLADPRGWRSPATATAAT